MAAEIIEVGVDSADAAIALWRTCGLTRPWNDPYSDFRRAVAGDSSVVLGTYDGSSGGAVST